MMDDAQLLRRYVADRSEAAFGELVRRHLNLVYSVALRQANGDAHLAQDAAQAVFTDLARKAPALAGRSVLAGWLFTSTRYAASKLIRAEQRRHAREQEAQLMHQATQDDGSAALDWGRARPVLDEALAALNEADREAVLLRYFEGRDYAEVGTRLRLTENAARMRVERALDKLQSQLVKRGLTSSSAALAAALANQAVVAAPAGLAATITGAALAGASATGIAASLAAFMTLNKVTVGIAGAIALAGGAGFMAQARTNTALRAEVEQLQQENQVIPRLEAENLRLARLAAEGETLRADDAELARLNDEADRLKQRMQVATQRVAQASAARTTYDPRNLDRMPRPTKQVRPEYPAELRSSGAGGEVLVDFVVDQTGVVRRAFAASSTLRAFESPAVAAVSQWTFEPGQKGGRVVNTHLQVKVVFSLATGTAESGAPTPYVPPKAP